jgi:hypothetical protein
MELRWWILWVAGGAGRAAALCLTLSSSAFQSSSSIPSCILFFFLYSFVNLEICHFHFPIQLKEPPESTSYPS